MVDSELSQADMLVMGEAALQAVVEPIVSLPRSDLNDREAVVRAL